MDALLTSHLPGLPAPRRGKVREIYDLGSELLIVSTDRVSAFDVVMSNGIPDKGRVLNLMSAYWFEDLADVCPNHLIAVEDGQVQSRLPAWHDELAGRSALTRKARPLPVECVARGYLAGSLYREYLSEGGGVHGLGLPNGLLESSKLPSPVFSPASKSDEGHDENISFAEVCNRIGREAAEQVRDWTLELFQRASRRALERGLILADTKFEFGATDDGLIWIDEALTPDSSRYWDSAVYQPGRSQDSYDKQFLRDWLEASGWNKMPPGPALPLSVVQRTREKYLEAFERITGRPLLEPART